MLLQIFYTLQVIQQLFCAKKTNECSPGKTANILKILKEKIK